MTPRTGLVSAALLLAAGAAIAAPAPRRAAGADTVAVPRERGESYVYDLLYHSVVRPATRTLDVARLARRVAGKPREAANIDARDEVRLPSTWWQPRIGAFALTPEQVGRGPVHGGGPAPGRWTVTKAKTQGVTPGFQIEDSKGAKFLVKFDPAAYPGLLTAADVIGSRLFWAAGYNVPENTIERFRLDDLDISPKAKMLDARGHEQPMTKAALEQVLDRVARDPQGRYRCMASRLLAGKPLGPFDYEGRRADDPEDRVPHELRRELRGMWAMCAWVNHADSRSANTLDMWVDDGGRSFVRHYLIDFGATLGAGGNAPKSFTTGTEYDVDYGVAARSFGTLGLAPFQWEHGVDPHMPAAGTFESRAFDPAGWRPDYPNPAFDERTARDIRWGARIVAAFTDADIRAAVAAGEYDDPAVTRYVMQVLIDRRDAIARRWLGAEPPALRAQQ